MIFYFGSGSHAHFGDEGLVNFIELGSSLEEIAECFR
jgi:hypothetical protein